MGYLSARRRVTAFEHGGGTTGEMEEPSFTGELRRQGRGRGGLPGGGGPACWRVGGCLVPGTGRQGAKMGLAFTGKACDGRGCPAMCAMGHS